MILYDLKCGAGHVFEGWFGSSADYDDQKARGLLSCPLCGTMDVGKAVMAPAVGAKSNQRSEGPSRQVAQNEDGGGNRALPVSNMPDPAVLREALTALANAQSEALKNSEWVGRGFAEKARAMHYGEAEHRPIHGEASSHEAQALVEEGVSIAPLPLPVLPPETKN